MEKIIDLLNEMKKKHILKDYAIGGSIGAMAWTEVFFTKDIDIFVILSKKSKSKIITFDEIYNYLKAKGYGQWTGTFIKIGNWLADFLPADKPLWKEAVEKSVNINYQNRRVKVMKPEYLIALLIDSARPGDRRRMKMLYEQANIEKKILGYILKKFNLLTKFKKLKIYENKTEE